MNKILEQSLLYDFYADLLTVRQKEIYDAVILNDMSLAEVAEEYNISRQAVHDMVHRCEKLLAGYEEKLQLVSKFLDTKKRINEIHQHAATLLDMNLPKEVKEHLDGIEAISNSILTEL